jgi:hypothetical protein
MPSTSILKYERTIRPSRYLRKSLNITSKKFRSTTIPPIGIVTCYGGVNNSYVYTFQKYTIGIKMLK